MLWYCYISCASSARLPPPRLRRHHVLPCASLQALSLHPPLLTVAWSAGHVAMTSQCYDV